MKRNVKVIESAKKDALKVSEMQNVKGGGICLCNKKFANAEDLEEYSK